MRKVRSLTRSTLLRARRAPIRPSVRPSSAAGRLPSRCRRLPCGERPTGTGSAIGRRGEPPRLLLVALALVALCAAGGAVVQQLAGGSTRGWRRASAARRVAPPVPAATRERGAADESALSRLRAWDARRAAAWASADRAALRALYVPGSVAGRRDVAMLDAWTARGLRVRGLRMQVLAARVRVHRDARVVLRVTDRVARAVAVGPGVRRPPAAGRAVDADRRAGPRRGHVAGGGGAAGRPGPVGGRARARSRSLVPLGVRLSRPGDPSAAASSDHGPTAATRPSTSTTTRSAWASAARLEVAPITVAPRSRSARPQLDLGGGVERGGDVVGEQQLGVAGQRPGQREPLHLAAGQPDAAVADQGVGAAGGLDVGAQPGRLERRPRPRGRRGRAATLSVKVPDSTRGTWATWATRPGRRKACGSATRSPFQRISPVLVDQPGQRRRAGWTCPEPTWPSSSTSSPGADGRGRRR